MSEIHPLGGDLKFIRHRLEKESAERLEKLKTEALGKTTSHC